MINFLRLVVGNFCSFEAESVETLDAMAKEADLFAEAHGGVFSCVNKEQRDNNRGAAQSKPESKPSGKPEIKCGICGKGHLTIRCYKNPDRKQAYSAEVAGGSKGRNSDYGGENKQGTQIKSEESESSRGRGYTRGHGRGFFVVVVRPTVHHVVADIKWVFVKLKLVRSLMTGWKAFIRARLIVLWTRKY